MTQKKKHTTTPIVKEIESTKVVDYEIFKIVEIQGSVMIAVTNQVVSRNKFETVEEAKAYIDTKPWDLILNSVAVMQALLAKQETTNK